MKIWAPFAALAVLSLGALSPQVASAQSKPLPYRIFADTVQARVCITKSVFNPGDTIVWRAEVEDASGVRMTADQIKAKGIAGTITLADGTKLPLSFGVHPPFPNAPKTDLYWAAAWYVKPDHPTGTLPWTLTVTDNSGALVTFTPIGQANGASVLTLAEKAVPAPPKT
jgi:hypothetical protein